MSDDTDWTEQTKYEEISELDKPTIDSQTEAEFRLDPDQVRDTFSDCLFDTKPEAEAALENGTGIMIKGIVWDVIFKTDKLDEHADLIMRMLMELPEQFRQSAGGGWSFLNACDDRHGRQWTSFHETMGMLFMMGEGCGYVTSPIPRDMWNILPGGMPYYVIMDKAVAEESVTEKAAASKSEMSGPSLDT